MLNIIIDNEIVTKGNLASAIKEKIEANLYPRLFVMTQGIEIYPSKDEIIQKVFQFTNLDFRDKVTVIKLVVVKVWSFSFVHQPIQNFSNFLIKSS